MARENVRTTRDVLPAQAWELVNELHLYVEAEAARAVVRQRRFEFLETVIARNQQISGLIESTVLHDHSLWFLRLGRLLERADMTTRIVDTGVEVIMELAKGSFAEVPLLWANLLHSLSATSGYRRKVGPTLEADQIVTFVFSDTQFPRSVLYCLQQIEEVVGALRGPPGLLRMLRRAGAPLQKFHSEDLDLEQLHAFIDQLQIELANINLAINETWFAPEPE